MKKMNFLPVFWRCPICHEEVKTLNNEGSQVGCKCITVSYDGRRLGGIDGIIPGPGDLIPRWREGKSVDYADIQEETAFRWERLVAQIRAEKGSDS